jgi:hypothetical protein
VPQISSIIAVYVPQSIAASFSSAVLSAAHQAGTTGNVVDIITSALAATTPPSWVTLLPSSFQPNIITLASALASLESTLPTATGNSNSAITGISTVSGNLVS